MSYIKKFIIFLKGLIPTKLKTKIKKLKKYNGYNELDKKMLEFINYKDGFYIDCGANDGVNQSTTWFYEKQLNWKGILIEPIPFVFDELKKNRNKNNYFKNCALISKDFKEENIEFYYNKKDTLTGTLKDKNNTEKIRVKASTLDKVIDDTNYQGKIDFFSLDVEDNEIEVLDGIDFNKHIIEYMLIETDNFVRLKNFLIKKNYKYLKRLSNYKFVDKPDYGDYLFKRIK
jgi:FkbM family methyltransferase